MKVKELIAELAKVDQEKEVTIAVYDCGGFNDSYTPDDVEEYADKDYRHTQINISVGCATHRKWTTDQNCPVNKIEAERKKIEDLQQTLQYYKDQFELLEKQFSERNRK